MTPEPIHPNKLQILIEAIERREGFGPPSNLPTRLNNPGDLMYANQPHAKPYPVKGTDGKTRYYAAFDTLEHGTQALRNQITLDASTARHESIADFIGKYAPPSENNTGTYLAAVMLALGVTNPNTPLRQAIADNIAAPTDPQPEENTKS
jgi:hypothetical protein